MKYRKEKSKTMVNSNNEHATIFMYGTLLEYTQMFIYIGVVLKSDGSLENEFRSRSAESTSATVRLNTIWLSKNVTFLLDITYTSH